MILHPVLAFILSMALIAMAIIFGSTLFAFMGGLACFFVGIQFINIIWLGMIFMGLGIYFVVAAVWMEREG